MLVRGIYYEGWRPQVNPTAIRRQNEFLARIQEGLTGSRPMDPRDVAQAVFQVLEHHIDPGEVEKVKHALPAELRALWPDAGAHACGRPTRAQITPAPRLPAG